MTLKWMVLLGFVVIATQVDAEETQVLKTQKDKVNYAIGVNLVGNIRQQGIEIDLDLVIKGMKDASSGGKLLLTDDELRKSISLYQTAVRQKQGAKTKLLATAESRKAGEKFLAENKKKEGVVNLPSGLQYKVLKAGDGKIPTDADTVVCNYRGTLINGTVIDSSDSDKPATFKVKGELLSGLREALKLMPVGSRWQLFIPSQLAYGEAGLGSKIGPDEVLVFEVELLSIK